MKVIQFIKIYSCRFKCTPIIGVDHFTSPFRQIGASKALISLRNQFLPLYLIEINLFRLNPIVDCVNRAFICQRQSCDEQHVQSMQFLDHTRLFRLNQIGDCQLTRFAYSKSIS